MLHESGGAWVTVGKLSGSVPAAPAQSQLLALAMRAGSYDGIRLGDDVQHLALKVTAGQVEPLLLGIDSGRLVTGAVYVGTTT